MLLPIGLLSIELRRADPGDALRAELAPVAKPRTEPKIDGATPRAEPPEASGGLVAEAVAFAGVIRTDLNPEDPGLPILT